MALPLVAIGPNLVPPLERIVRGTVDFRKNGVRMRYHTRPYSLAVPVPKREPNAGLAHLLTCAEAIRLGKIFVSKGRVLPYLKYKQPLRELASRLGLTLTEARMCLRLYIMSERGAVDSKMGIREAEIAAGLRDADGRIVEDFR